jgi:ATP-binding protein involved in chromosome partitioning
MDPRVSIIDDRLKDIKRIIPVVSGKGGVGKSSLSALIALSLQKRGFNVGLLDLDFYGSSIHLILDMPVGKPLEKRGILPLTFKKIKYMSIIPFSSEKPFAVRGEDLSNAFIELLSITIWGSLDFLIIDMPPGMGEISLDVIKLIKRAEYIVVTKSSFNSFEVVKKIVIFLLECRKNIIGIIENMKIDESSMVKEFCIEKNLEYLGSVGYYRYFEEILANPDQNKLSETVDKIVESFVKF